MNEYALFKCHTPKGAYKTLVTSRSEARENSFILHLIHHHIRGIYSQLQYVQ